MENKIRTTINFFKEELKKQELTISEALSVSKILYEELQRECGELKYKTKEEKKEEPKKE